MNSTAQSTSRRVVDVDASSPKNEEKEHSPSPSVTKVSHLRLSDASQDGSAAAKHGAQWVTGTELAALSIVLIAAMFLMMLDTSIIATAIPRITDEFRSLQDVGWYVSIYQLANAALQPLWGRIYDKFSNKSSFLASLAIFELGSLVCGVAISSRMLIGGRAIASIGSAGLVSGGLTIAASAVPLEKRAPLTAMLMGFAQLGIAIGPLLGGAFTSYTTWRWCFYINLPIGGILAIGLFRITVPDQCRKPNPWSLLRRLHLELDLLGFALIAPAAFQLLLALSWGGSKYAWNSATIIGLFCAAGVTALLWLVWDWYRGDEALIPISIIKVQLTGYVIPYAMLAAAIGSISNGLYSTFSPTTSMSKWVGYQVLNGAGRGVGMPMAILAVQAALPPTDLAMGNSVVIFVQSLGTAITLAISDAIFEGSLESELPKQAPLADAAAIIAAGATHFRSTVSEQDLPGVLAAYSLSINRVFYLAAGVSSLGLLTALGMGWVNVSKKRRAGEDGIPLQDLSA
ncbi:major facilitator superfamily domain-containing protein [Parachaetomium inaequale]|uniref:Major facilitator superfamily domain-containing protein n=1 Tax=Parachaetomium inaequale TaxID=2588326 RepID=A0AAN6SMZ6_9PEZI|nr:major facilitator superfamily domain-containing protein [Parachaetomium inaequale]